MSDIYERVTGDQNFLQKLLGKVPGFSGYLERESRRASDKILREFLAQHFEDQWKRLSSVQRDLISQGSIEYVDDLEHAAIKLRQFIDRLKTAAHGYAPFFDAIKVNEQELAMVYEYDNAMLGLEAEVSRGIDNLESSLGTDGLPAAIRNLNGLAQKCVDVFNKRAEIMKGGTVGASQ